MRRALLLAAIVGALAGTVAGRAAAQDGESGDEAPPVAPARLRADLEQGARLFRRHPDLADARAYAAREAWTDVDWNGRTITVRDPWLSDRVNDLDALAPTERRKALDEIADHLSARAAAVDADLAAAAASASPGATAHATPAASGAPTPSDPDEVLRGILAQRQFHTENEDPRLAQAAAKVRDSIHAGWERVKGFVRDLFSQDTSHDTLATRLRRWGAVVVAFAAISLAVFFVVRALLARSVDDDVRPEEDELPEAPPRPEVMAAKAESLAAAGDRRGAVRALYLALLGELHGQGAIEYDRHRTNREYLRTMRLEGDRASAFAGVVEVFDRKWYGKEPCSEPELGDFRALVQRASYRGRMAA